MKRLLALMMMATVLVVVPASPGRAAANTIDEVSVSVPACGGYTGRLSITYTLDGVLPDVWLSESGGGGGSLNVGLVDGVGTYTRDYQFLPGDVPAGTIIAVTVKLGTVPFAQDLDSETIAFNCSTGELASTDTTPPTISGADDRIVETGSTSGAVAAYGVAATDEDPPDPIVVCSPADGVLLPLGDTFVDCTAADAAGNSAAADFTVTVVLVVDDDTFNEVATTVESFGLSHGLVSSLRHKLDNANDSFNNGNIQGACAKLGAFVHQVDAQDGKKLTPGQAEELRQAARSIAAAIDCGSG